MPFARPSLADLIERAIDDINLRVDGADARLRRSTLNALAKVTAGAAHGLYGFIDWASRQVLPDSAESDVLDRWASIWGVTRKPAAKATGNVTCTGVNGSIIPAGTALMRSDGAEFTTDADAAIVAGTATVSVTAVDPGAAGNIDAGAALVFMTPIAGVNSQATVAAGGITQGTEEEQDEALRGRLIDRLQQPPQAGALSDYVEWALEVSGVTRAWAFSRELGPGTVTVRFVRDDDAATIIPDAGEVAAVQTHIDAVRPVTASVTVVAPIADALNFTIDLVTDTQAIRDAVTTELKDLIMREASPGGTLPISHIREAISIAAGVTDYVLTVPAADVVSATGHIPVFGAITWL